MMELCPIDGGVWGNRLSSVRTRRGFSSNGSLALSLFVGYNG